MTFDEYDALIPEDCKEEQRDTHKCNSKCAPPRHFDLAYEIGDTLTEESILERYGTFHLRIISSKRILEYPTQIPGTHVNTTGAWEIEYYYKQEVEGEESYLEGMINLLRWKMGWEQANDI